MANKFIGASVPGVTTAAATGPVADSSTVHNAPSSYGTTPANELNPTETPSAWGITNPSMNLYTGGGNTTVPRSTNQVLAAIADHYGVQPSKQISVMQQAETALAAHLGIRQVKGQTIMSQITKKLGLTALSGNLNTAGSGVWGQIAQKVGIALPTTPGQGPDTTANIVDTAKTIYNLNAAQLTDLQNKMYSAGYYNNDVRPGTSTTFTPGHLDVYTMQAWGTLLTDASNAYTAKGQKVTWMEMLSDQIQDMNSKGGIESVLGTAPSNVTVATTDQMKQAAQDAYEKALGRGATPAEVQALTSSFDAQQLAHQGSIDPTTGAGMATDQSGIQQVPGVPSETQAAENSAEGNTQEFNAHNMALAGSKLMSAISGSATIGTGL